MKNSLEGFNSRIQQVEEIISKSEDKSIEINLSEEQKRKKNEETGIDSQRTSGTRSSLPTYTKWKFQKERRKGGNKNITRNSSQKLPKFDLTS